jgi:transposase
VSGINLTIAAGLVAQIGDMKRFTDPGKLVSYVGLNPKVHNRGFERPIRPDQ